MGSRALTIKRHDLERFVADFQDKAVDYLLRSCHIDNEIEKEILRILLDEPASSSSNPISNEPRGPPGVKTSPTSQRTGSFSSHRRQTSHSYPRPNAEPPSPPKSRSNHSKSQSGRDGIENILILSPTDDDDIKRSVASMKPAQIRYSVIGEHMFEEGRIPENNIEEVEDLHISIPKRGAPGSFISVTVTSCAELTWKSMRAVRTTSKASHCTVFYLVPQEFLDIDVLLGILDSGEGQGLNLREDESYHRSDNAGIMQPDEIVQEFIRNQQQQTSAVPYGAPVARPRQRGEALRTSNPVPADPDSSTPSAEQGADSQKFRISCRLDATTFNINLDLDAHPRAFVDSVQKEFKKRRLIFLQADTGIWLKPEKEASDEDSHYVSLIQDDLEDNWTEIKDWLMTNKKADSKVMYGDLQIDPD